MWFPEAFKNKVMQCITTSAFSLALNGALFGYFPAARYRFKFHPLCKQLRITNLMFADDVLMFSNGDATSMMLILQSFSTFSKTSGLKVSACKTNAYFNRVHEELKQDILRVSCFCEGTMPFKYLGMPIQTTRLKKKRL
ncbi:uncharacterized protein LOC141618838 [Silene latifolia]|uniref:uncharacterized protein LOC141618838 n=1 Tax=Silene latifolia TaxID=37657 RepID=UPI003D782DFF